MSSSDLVEDAPTKDELDWKKDDLKTEQTSGGIVDMVDGRIDGYKLDRVLQNGFFKVKAPVFSHPFVAQQTALVVGAVVVVAGVFVGMHKVGYFELGGSIVAQSSAIFGYFAGLSGFLFGFYVFDQLGNYMTVKNNYVGGYWGSFADLMFLTSTWLPNTDKKTQLFKQTVVRWGMATFALMCGSADDQCSDAENIEKCRARGLLTPEEAQVVTDNKGRVVTPLMWMLECYETNLSGLSGSDFKVDKAEAKINGMRNGVGGVLCAVGTWGQTPLPLVHLMSALVKIQLILLSGSEGIHVASIIVGDAPGKFPQLIFVLIMVVCTPIVFQGLLEFVIQISNPFGHDWVDFPTMLWYAGIRDEMFQYVAAAENAATLSSVRAVKR